MKIRPGMAGHFFYCPGCESLHQISDAWEFDGNLESPTISPSILVRPNTCHSFVRNGMIEFLSDSEHHLSGQTVPLPELPVWALPEDER